jgi:hypothetical protein
MNKNITRSLLISGLTTASLITGSVLLSRTPAQAGWAPWVQVFVENYPEGNNRDYWENVRVVKTKLRKAIALSVSNVGGLTLLSVRDLAGLVFLSGKVN